MSISETPPLPHARLRSAARHAVGARGNLGLAVLGAGLLALAAVEAGLLVQQPRRALAGEHGGSSEHAGRVERTEPALPLGSQAATPPEASGKIIGIACDSTTTGTTLYRLWGSGRIEAMMLGDTNVWTEWTPVAPGLNGNLPKKKGSQDSG